MPKAKTFRRHVFMAAAGTSLLAASAGCTVEKSTSDVDPARTKEFVAEAEASGKPLMNVVNPPTNPPDVWLVSGTGGGRTIQHAVAFQSAWVIDGRLRPLSTPLRVPWPEPVTYAKGETLAFAVDTSVHPRNVVVQAFTTLEEDTGHPRGQGITLLDCWLEELARPGPCELSEVVGGGLELRAPALPTATPLYLSVYASWLDVTDVYTDDVRVVSMTWLLAVDSAEGPP